MNPCAREIVGVLTIEIGAGLPNADETSIDDFAPGAPVLMSVRYSLPCERIRHLQRISAYEGAGVNKVRAVEI
jgi:hypothetical protein